MSLQWAVRFGPHECPQRCSWPQSLPGWRYLCMSCGMVVGLGKVPVERGCLAAVLLGLSGCASNKPKPLGPVIEAEELPHRLSDKEKGRLVVLDVRDLAGYEQGHGAGAVRVGPAAGR